MLILAISDIHGAVGRLSGMESRARDADLVLVAGDITDFGGAAEARRFVAALGEARGKTAAVPGNCDKRAAREVLESEGLSADGRLVSRGGALVAGSGGSPLRTGLTPYERREGDIASSLRTSAGEAAASDGSPLIVLTHAPPRDSGADEQRGMRIGSAALREALDSIEPALWVCGHIHESPCARLSGRSLVVNPGPLDKGRYAMVSLERGPDGSWRASAELRTDA